MSDEEVREDTQDDEKKKSQAAPDETVTWTSQTRGRITAYVYSFGSGSGGHKEVDDILNTSLRLVRGTINPEAAAKNKKIPARKGMYLTDQR